MIKKLIAILFIALFFFSGNISSALAALEPLPPASSPFNIRDRYQTDLFTGSASYSYPIKVTKGTNDLTPEVSLAYNSAGIRDFNQQAGAGWQLNRDYIERDVKFTPGDTSDDKFKLHFRGGVYELIYVASENRYHTKIESNLHIQKLSGGQNDQSDYWQVITQDGTKYRYGYQSQSELICTGRSFITHWNLDLVTDTHGNKIFYTYTEANGAATLTQIKYNNDQSRIIDFTYATNTYQKPIYAQGCTITDTAKLSAIQVKVNTTVIRSYDLGYTTAYNGQSQLTAITEKGSDGTALPATTFEYKPVIKNWPQSPEYWIYGASIDVDLTQTHVVQADVNGDGLSDIVKSQSSGNNTNWDVYLNKGGHWDSTAIRWGTNISEAYNLASPEMRVVDVTGDNLPDIVRIWGYNWLVWRNTGTSWNTSPEYWLNGGSNIGYDIPVYEAHLWNLVDVTGDGLADIVHAPDHSQWFVWRNTGSTWSTTKETWATGLDAKLGETDTRMMDVNGDGLVDIVRSTTTNGTYNTWRVWKNTGSGFTSVETWINNANIDASVTMNNVTVQDVNGDGLPDIVKALVDPNRWMVLLNKGNSWPTTWEEWANPNGPIAASMGGNVQMADVNGDGLADIIRTVNNGGNVTWQVWKNNGVSPDLLSSVKTAQGGTISFDYIKSTGIDNTGADDLSDLPFNTWVVSTMTTSNGLSNEQGTSDVTTYSYKNGFYKWQDREFRGFGEVNVVEPNGTKKTYLFHQDDGRAGTTQSVTTKNSSDALFAKTEQTWSNTSANGVYTVNLTSEKQYTYDGESANPKITQTDYQYDSYGNITKQSELGDTSVTGDERFTYNEYVYNTTSWIVNTIKHTFLKASNDTTTVAETWNYYDGATDNNTAPVKGDVTKEEKWLSGSTNPTTTYEYDTYGNVTKVTDAKGNSTTYTYDSAPSTPAPITISGSNTISTPGDVTWRVLDGMSITENFTSPTIHLDFSANVTSNSEHTTTYVRSLIDGVEKDFVEFLTPWGSGGSGTMTFSSDRPITPGQHTITVEIWTNSPTLTIGNRTFTVTQSTVSLPATYPKSETNAKNQTTLYNYDLGTGNLLSKTDPNSNAISYEYDVFGRVTKEIKPYDTAALPTTQYTYFTDGVAPEGVLVAKRETSGAAGMLDVYTWSDGLSRAIQTRAEAEDTSKQIVVNKYYDPTGEAKKESVPHHDTLSTTYATPVADTKKTELSYDVLGRVTIVKNPKGDSKTIAYDHWKETTIDENGHIKREFKNAFDKINKVEEVNGITTYTTTYEYDVRNLLTKITDNQNNENTLTYDSLGRKTSQTDPDMGTWSYVYDAASNLTSQTDNKNVTITKTYDELNRLTKTDHSTDVDILFTYDGNSKLGTLTSVTDKAGTVNYSYDNRLRKTQETRVIDSTSMSTQFTYDALDRVLTRTNPDNEVVTYNHNNQGEIESVAGLVSNIDYNALGKITNKSFANGLTTNYSYNTDDFRLNNITTGSVQNLGYTYDAVGNVTTRTNNLTSKTETFTYDSLDRLKTASESGGYNYEYDYNSIGNLTKFTDASASAPIDYTYGEGAAGAHALTSSTETASSSGTTDITVSSVTTGADNDGGSTATTASSTPTANTLQLLSVASRTDTSTNPNQPTVTGNGLTWVAVGSKVYDTTSSTRRRVTLFRAMGTTPTSGALTIDFGGQNQTDVTWAVDQAVNVDTSGTNGSGAVLQSVTNSDESGTATSLTVTLGAFANATNATYGVFGDDGNTTATAGSGFSLRGQGESGTDLSVTSEFNNTNDTTVDMTLSPAGLLGGIAVELKAGSTVVDPIVLQAEDYDTGGEGVAYHDYEPANNGGVYRPSEGVDLVSFATNQYKVGWTRQGEWLKYSFTATTSGTYTFNAKVGTPHNNSKFHAEIDGVDATGLLTVNSSGGWDNWQTISKSGINLTAGQHVLKIVMDQDSNEDIWIADMDLFSFTYETQTSPTPTPTPTPTAGPTPTPTATPTPTPGAGTELLTSPWTLTGNNGAAEANQAIAANSLNGKTSAEITFDLNGSSFGGGDDEASIVFVQNGDWRAANVTFFGAQNGFDGTQTITIPLTSFHKVGNAGITLDPEQSVSDVHARFWKNNAFTVNITSIKLISSGSSTPTPTLTPTPTSGPTPTPTPTSTPTPTPAGGIVSGQIYRLINQCGEKALDVDNNSQSDGGNVHVWTWYGGNNQRWKIETTSTGYYKLTAQHSGKVLDVANTSTADGANVQQYTWNSVPNQEWSITDIGNGYYKLLAKHSSKALDVNGASSSDGANVHQWTENTSCAQKWQIIAL